MIPDKGQHVKCFMRTGTVAEGLVVEWADGQIVLESLTDKSLMIIHSPSQDIVLTKVLVPDTELPLEKLRPLAEVFEELPSPDDGEEKLDPLTLQAKTTAELKIEMAKQEREIIAKKLKSHHPDTSQTPRKMTYGYPRFFQKPSAK